MLSDAVRGVTRVTLDEKKRNSARRDVLADTRGGVLVRGGVLGDVTYLLIRVAAGFLYGRCSWRRPCGGVPARGGVLGDVYVGVLAGDVRLAYLLMRVLMFLPTFVLLRVLYGVRMHVHVRIPHK